MSSNVSNVLLIYRNTIWPDGKRSNQSLSRDENTKQRTQMAAKMSLFAVLAGENYFPID